MRRVGGKEGWKSYVGGEETGKVERRDGHDPPEGKGWREPEWVKDGMGWYDAGGTLS